MTEDLKFCDFKMNITIGRFDSIHVLLIVFRIVLTS